MKLFTIIAAAAMAAVTSASAAEPFVVQNRDATGGDIVRHLRSVEKVNSEGRQVRIEANAVTSAGTFWLLADDVCIANPRAIFEFHGPQNTGIAMMASAITFVPLPVSFMGKERAEQARRIMAAEYNDRWPGLGDWFYWKASKKAGMMVTKVRASELNRAFGIPLCEGA